MDGWVYGRMHGLLDVWMDAISFAFVCYRICTQMRKAMCKSSEPECVGGGEAHIKEVFPVSMELCAGPSTGG